MQQKDFGVIQKVRSLKTSNFQPAFPMFIPVHFTCRMLMNFWMKNWGVKREKKIIFRWQCFLHRYDMIARIKIFKCWYIKKSSKKCLLATAKQLIRRNSICRLKNQAILQKVSIEIDLAPPLHLLVFICSLKTSPPPSTTNPLLKRIC